MTKHIHIRISGARGAGKTELLREIGVHLQSRGLSVTCFDEGYTHPLDGVELLSEYEPRPVVIEAETARASRLNDGEFRHLVTALRTVANQYAGTEQLREQIALALRAAL